MTTEDKLSLILGFQIGSLVTLLVITVLLLIKAVKDNEDHNCIPRVCGEGECTDAVAAADALSITASEK